MPIDSGISFKISGSALSFLYYECGKSRTDQVGFLVGEKNSYVTKTISDSEQNGEKNETVFSISAVLPVGTPFGFHNNFGRIDRNRLMENLGPFKEKVCGWYLFRRNTRVNPLTMGTVLHKELLQALNVDGRCFPLCCIGSDFDCGEDASNATIQLKHVFLLFTNGFFRPISVLVTNLGQPEDNAYKTEPLSAVTNSSFLEIMTSIKNLKDISGLQLLKALQHPLQEKIVKVASQVQWADKRAQDLTKELEEINYQKVTAVTEQCFGEFGELDNGEEKIEPVSNSPTPRINNTTVDQNKEVEVENFKAVEEKEQEEDEDENSKGDEREDASDNSGMWVAKKRKRRKNRKNGQSLTPPTSPV